MVTQQGHISRSIAETKPEDLVPIDQIVVMVLYLAIFVFAETAFVLMAKYLQDYLELEDSDLIEQGAPQMAYADEDKPGPTAR